MDHSTDLNITYETDNRSPLKELQMKINQPAEACDNQNKNLHLFDMDSTFLQNTVLMPAEIDSIQKGEHDDPNNSNQENLKPRFSILNTFDPIIKEDTDEVKLSDSYTDNLLNGNLLNIDTSSGNKIFVNLTVEDCGEKGSVNDTFNASALELNRSSISNISSQSENSVINRTVILNNSSTVESSTPVIVKPSDSGDSDLIKVQNLKPADEIAVDESLNLSTDLSLNDFTITNSTDCELVEQNSNSSEQSYVSTDSSTLKPDDSQPNSFNDSTSLNESAAINNQNNKTVIDHFGLRKCIESESTIPGASDSFIDAFVTKLVLVESVEKPDDTEIKDTITNAEITNDKFETAEQKLEITVDLESKCNLLSNFNEVPHEISLESLKIVNDLIEEQQDKTSNNHLIESNEIEVSVETNEASETPAIESKNITIQINNNTEVKEILNEVLKEEDKEECCQEIKNVSFEINSSKITDAAAEFTKEEIKEESSKEQLSSNTYENKSVIHITETVITLNSLIEEETHMSASESNSNLNESTVASRLSLETNAACTNEMGEIINQNECFEKQSDIMNGAIDNKESLEAKAQVYKEMAEKYAIVEAECEKFKVQVADLKKELKSSRQKTVALEAEVADLKRRENELNVLLEEYKKSAASKGDVKEQDEQLHRLQASEDALKNEVKELTALVKQHESRLKELQRKEVKLADDLTNKTQSEMEISRVMEEYEKSISSLISENEKTKKERDTIQIHLSNIEMAFSDVHQKYERCKAVVQGYKNNEDSFKQDIAMNRETIVIQEQKYESLKAHAMSQLEISNQELATMKKQHETEMSRLTAQLKRLEIKNQSLMESLQQKAKECEQLSAVCDEFIGNV